MYYKGRLTIPDFMNMSLGDINFYYKTIFTKSSTEEGKKELAANQVMNEVLEGGS